MVLEGQQRLLHGGSVLDAIHERSLTTPDRAAVVDGERVLSYVELSRRVDARVAHLLARGAGPGDRIAVWADRSAETVVAMLAVLRLGAAYVPVDPTYPVGRIRAVLAASRAALLLLSSASPVAPPSDLGLEQVDLDPPTPLVGPSPLAMPTRDTAAYVLYTSGTTGLPKGVVVDHGALLNYCTWAAETLIERPGTVPLFGSLGFDHTVTSLWPVLMRGGSVVVCGGIWDSPRLLGPDEPHAMIKVTPSQLRFLDSTGTLDLARATDRLVLGGEELRSDLLDSLAHRLEGVRLVNHYGPTEATVGCLAHALPSDRSAESHGGAIPIGRPIHNMRARIVDADLRPVAEGEAGELVVSGPGVARGYLDDAEATDAAFLHVDGAPEDRAYHTGDRVRRLPSGDVVYLGRVDDQLKVSGHRLETQELRRHALAVGGVVDVRVRLRPGTPDQLEAFVVATADAGDVTEGVRRRLAEHLPSALVPRLIHLTPALATNAHGKVDLDRTLQLIDGGPDT